LRVRSDAWPRFGGFSLTPERRAFDKPIAIACFVDRAPCLPFRTCSISSRTNSPACVVGAFPSRFAFRARFTVFGSGIPPLLPSMSDSYEPMHVDCQSVTVAVSGRQSCTGHC
jgi:hypothetical protein